MRPELAKHLSPKQLELAEIIGVEGAILLSEHWPGVRLPVPHNVRADHPIVLAIGMKRAEALCEHYGGEPVTVPRGAAYLRALRNAEMLRRYHEGASARALAVEYGLHENHSYALVARQTAEQQGDLFHQEGSAS